ncbi:SEC-C metal-binding domain-containing protein [Proteinivorax hydrogeniformans]|uniref:SEC-C metal-binding domain-containing protein n=1 Tax=Proteinivorax hydrogeniformans TaxID=1826727 RepID=A0AAU8HRQ7_9FIRM
MNHHRLLTKEEIGVLNNVVENPTEGNIAILEKIKEEFMLETSDDLKSLLMDSIDAIEKSKAYPEVKPPFTLQKMLNTLTKEELTIIRQTLQIKGASKLRKKELIEVLSSKIPDALGVGFYHFDQMQFEFIKKVAKKGGVLQCRQTTFYKTFYGAFGIMFACNVDGEFCYVIPEEILPQINELAKDKELKSIIQRNTKWIRITKGLLHYYGALDFKDYFKLMEHYAGIEISNIGDLLSIIDLAEAFYGNPINRKYFYINEVNDPNRIIEEQEARRDLEFYPFSYEEVYSAGQDDFVERTPWYKKLIRFFTFNYDMPLAEAEEEANYILTEIRADSQLSEILDEIKQSVEIPNIEVTKEITSILVELNNNTRKWALKGHKPVELRTDVEGNSPSNNPNSKGVHLAVDNTKTEPKVSRNKPCPCGSGKKYKRCCGK